MPNGDRVKDELIRLKNPPSADALPGGAGTVRFTAGCLGRASEVLLRAKSVLTAIDKNSSDRWPTDEQWARLLPQWFVDCCAADRSAQADEKWLKWWRSLSEDEQARVERETPWTLSNWIYWFAPENRHWYWWDAIATSPDSVLIASKSTDGRFRGVH
jgi:hypothetical protein